VLQKVTTEYNGDTQTLQNHRTPKFAVCELAFAVASIPVLATIQQVSDNMAFLWHHPTSQLVAQSRSALS